MANRPAELRAELDKTGSITGSDAFIQTNIVDTYTLLEAARAYCDALPAARRDKFRFLHVSTDEVYGSLGDAGLFTEMTPYQPSSPKSDHGHRSRFVRRAPQGPNVVRGCPGDRDRHELLSNL